MDSESLLSKLNKQLKASKDYSKPLWDRRRRSFNLYMGFKPKRKYRSDANFHVPYTATLLDNVWPLLTNKLPFAEVTPRNSDRDSNAARLMNELVRYTFQKNDFELTFLNLYKECMLFADSWVKVCWKYQGDEDHPEIRHLNTFDVYIHPNKRYLDDRWPIFICSEMTKSQMRQEGWDEESINKLGESKLETPQYRREQRMALGLRSNPENDNEAASPEDELFEVVEVWEKTDLSKFAPKGDKMEERGHSALMSKAPESEKMAPVPARMGLEEESELPFAPKEEVEEEKGEEEVAYIVFANGETFLNESKGFKNPYTQDKDMYPLAKLSYNPIPHMLYAESFVEPIADMQDELNALENMKADNYKRRNNPPLKIRRSANVDLESLQFVSGMPWLLDEQDDIMPWESPDLTGSIDNQQQMIKENMQARTGANDMLLVSDETAMKGGDTALGASIANENTKMRFKPQASIIDLFIERIGKLVINRYQQKEFFDRERIFHIAGEDGKYIEEMIQPDMVQGDLQFVVNSGTSLAESQTAKIQKLIQIKSLYAQDPNINMDEIDRQLFEAAGFDFNKMKMSKEGQVQDLVLTLRKLVTVAQSAGFQKLSRAQQQDTLAQISRIKSMLQQLGGGSPGPESGNPNAQGDGGESGGSAPEMAPQQAQAGATMAPSAAPQIA